MTAGSASQGRLRFVVGAGQPQEIPEDVALRHSGKVENVLKELLGEGAIRDPQQEYQAMLANPRCVFECSSRGADGQEVETPLAPDDQWEGVLRQLKEGKDMEIGMAVSHVGG